jgi:uncharacterized cupin superfamily protein
MLNLETIAASWQARGFSFGAWEDFPNTLWEDIVNDKDELFMVVSGEIELKLGGECKRIQPGEEILIPAGIVRSKRILSPNGAQWLFGYRASD